MPNLLETEIALAKVQRAAEELTSSPDAEVMADLRLALGSAMDKRDGVGHMLALMKSREAFCRERAMAALDMAETLKRQRERLESWVKVVMGSVGTRRIDGGVYRFRLVENPGRVVVTGEVPERFQRTIPEKTMPNLAAIKEAIRRGEQLPFAHVEKSERLAVDGTEG